MFSKSHITLFGNKRLLIMACIMVITLSSCQSLEDIYSRLDNIEEEVNNLKSSVMALQEAYKQGKIIKSITPFADEKAGGWLVTFSDGHSIRIVNGVDGQGINGKDGTTPYLRINSEGYWTASYDNGQTFVALLDSEGNKIKVSKDGAEGQSVRLIINENGYYTIQAFHVSDPTTIINEVVTPYTSDASRIIASMTQDDTTHAITILMSNGNSFTFPMHYVSPTSIAILNVSPIYLSMGTQASVEFRVNPSNASFTLNGDDCQIKLDKIGAVQDTRSSYVTTPSNYKLVRVEQVYDGDTEQMKEGQYRAIIEDTKNPVEYDEMVALVLNTEDGNGNKIQISSSAIEVKGITLEKLPKTGLPIVIVNTPNSEPIINKTNWMVGATITIVNPDMSIDYQGTLSIKGRGNSTWGYPKKPYTIRFDKKGMVLGMKEHKHWVLLANWMDRTLMRNAVAFEIARNTDLEWTPSGRFVEVLLNGKHLGNYYLCEQIKVSENRVNIAKAVPTFTDYESITGGYIFELDTNYDEVFKFKSTRKDLPWMFKEPDEVNDAQFKWAVNYVNEMEDALCDSAKFANRKYADYMNLESYVDWWFVNELTMNNESSHPKSCYMYKNANGKMTAGPVWDYDWGTFTSWSTTSFRGKNDLYYPQLFNDPIFVTMIKTRWATFKPDFETKIPNFIEEIRNQIKESNAINAPMWPINERKTNGDESMSFDDAVDKLKSAYISKLNWLDMQIQSW